LFEAAALCARPGDARRLVCGVPNRVLGFRHDAELLARQGTRCNVAMRDVGPISPADAARG
jgi:hypothetical protein